MSTKTKTIPTATSLAALLSVARSTIHGWVAEGMPRRPDGGFDLDAVEAWRVQRAGADDDTDRAYWRARREKAEALAAEDRLAQTRGDLMPRAQRDRDLLSVVESFVAALDALPSTVVPSLTAARGRDEIDQLLRDHIRTMRIQLAAKHSPPMA